MKPDILTSRHPDKPSIVFFGTPDYVIPILDALKEAGYDIAAVVTQPEKAVGRKQVLTPSPVALWANKNGISVITDATALQSAVARLGANVGILAAYGKIIKQEVIEAFPKGIINVHPSLLPKFRGASPIAGAIAAGDRETGVTIIRLDEEMDHGPILDQVIEPVLPTDTQETLRARLFEKGARFLVKILPDYLGGKLILKDQEHSRATYVTMFKKEHGFIPPGVLKSALDGIEVREKWEIPFIKNYSLVPSAYCLERFIRAVTPWPGAYTNVKMKNKRILVTTENVKRIKIIKAHVGDGKLQLDEVQLEGKRPVSWRQFVEGYPHATFSS